MNADANTVSIVVDNFQMKINAKAYARALFVDANGDAVLSINIRQFRFIASPKL
jgi:hypothetical protein